MKKYMPYTYSTKKGKVLKVHYALRHDKSLQFKEIIGSKNGKARKLKLEASTNGNGAAKKELTTGTFIINDFDPAVEDKATLLVEVANGDSISGGQSTSYYVEAEDDDE